MVPQHLVGEHRGTAQRHRQPRDLPGRLGVPEPGGRLRPGRAAASADLPARVIRRPNDRRHTWPTTNPTATAGTIRSTTGGATDPAVADAEEDSSIATQNSAPHAFTWRPAHRRQPRVARGARSKPGPPAGRRRPARPGCASPAPGRWSAPRPGWRRPRPAPPPRPGRARRPATVTRPGPPTASRPSSCITASTVSATRAGPPARNASSRTSWVGAPTSRAFGVRNRTSSAPKTSAADDRPSPRYTLA
ncbi:hypothetical protein O1L55_01520 [Streptomyces albulus]|nr:hypothetical protein [Streptomyces noursei]